MSKIILFPFFIRIINIWNFPSNCESFFEKYEYQKSFYLHFSYLSLFKKYEYHYSINIWNSPNNCKSLFKKYECHYLHSPYLSSTFEILQIIVNYFLKSMNIKNHPVSILHMINIWNSPNKFPNFSITVWKIQMSKTILSPFFSP